MNIEKQSSTKQRVIFAGTPEFAAISLQALIEQQQALNIEIVAVYTQPDHGLSSKAIGAWAQSTCWTAANF